MNAKIQIRTAVPHEASTIARILAESFAEYKHFYTEKAFAATTPICEE